MSKSGETVSFVYNEDGLRVQKVAISTGTTQYTLHGKNIVHLTNGSNSLHFFYDAQNKPAVVVFNGTAYAYLYNLQGDVIGLVDANGRKVVEYRYDAWGRIMSRTGAMANTLGVLNPFRYRGYVYDEETGMYYLRNRYYNPDSARFINADALIAQIGCLHGNNLFAYAFNNPVAYSDSDGNWPDLSAVFAAVAVVAAVVAVAAAVMVTCGAAAPAIAIAGTGVVSGISAGATATAAAVGTTAMAVAGVSTAAAVTTYAVEKEVERRLRPNHTVYRLVDSNDVTQYVGRTTNVPARMAAHSANPYRANLEFVVIRSGLNYYEARGLEQIAMLSYHTINTSNRMNNQINGISPRNRLLNTYMEAGRGVTAYLENQVTNEMLYWTGR